MTYENIRQGIFLSRPNRFIAEVELNGKTVMTHVKNTGRCRELLIPGITVWIQECDKPNRKTKFDLIAVDKSGRIINMDSQAPNQVFAEWANAGLFVPGLTYLRPETTYQKSRFDFYWEAGDRRGFVEVKGVTLELENVAYFPDAPTERGLKHVEELIACHVEGYEAVLFFVIQMQGVNFWAPNDSTQAAFGEAVRRAAKAGVQILAWDCTVQVNQLALRQPVAIQI